ncbi:MAG: hypothetical protein GF313_07470 [Caldithrix sp.]|nr:hypothetical protein [Caldithrix sp.]
MKSIAFIAMVFMSVVSLQAQSSHFSVPFSEGYTLQKASITEATFQPSAKPLNENIGSVFEPQDENDAKKSVGKALLMSLVVPGSGEYYTGNRNHGLFFFSMELLAWGGLTANRHYSNHLMDEYRVFAVEHADVNPSGKDKQYWIDIGKYNDIYAYNEQRQRDRRFSDMYAETDVNYWNWQSKELRFRYDGKRIQASEIANREVYFFTAILLNHLVSGINAMRLARSHNREMQSNRWQLKVDQKQYADNTQYLGLRLKTFF